MNYTMLSVVALLCASLGSAAPVLASSQNSTTFEISLASNTSMSSDTQPQVPLNATVEPTVEEQQYTMKTSLNEKLAEFLTPSGALVGATLDSLGNSLGNSTSSSSSNKLYVDMPKKTIYVNWKFFMKLTVNALLKKEKRVEEAMKCVVGLPCKFPSAFKKMLMENGKTALMHNKCATNCTEETETMAKTFRQVVEAKHPTMYEDALVLLHQVQEADDADTTEDADDAYSEAENN